MFKENSFDMMLKHLLEKNTPTIESSKDIFEEAWNKKNYYTSSYTLRPKIKKVLIPLLCGISILFFISLYCSDSVRAISMNTFDKIKTMFTIDIPTTNPKIDSHTAIENAKKEFGDAKEIDAEYVLLTNQSFKLFSEKALTENHYLKEKGFMDKLPVYIVTFKGVIGYGNVPANSSNQPTVFDQFNVIVDATTGEVLMSFAIK